MIIIFGSTGFLGNYLLTFLKQKGLPVESVSRDHIHNESGVWDINKKIIKKMQHASTVINCIAQTNLLECEINSFDSTTVNANFPLILSKILPNNVNLIHISSDAMYESQNNFSNENTDILISNNYSNQKLKAEDCILYHPNTCVLRTSFIGYNYRNLGIVNHFISSVNRSREILGWNDAYTSSLHISHVCKIIDYIVSNPMDGIFNIGTLKPYTKFEFLDCLAQKLSLPITVRSIPSPCDEQLVRNKNLGMDSSKIFDEINMNGWLLNDVVQETYHEIKDFLKV